MKITRLFSVAAIMVAALALTSCNNKKFHINGNITEAQDSMLYLENISLNGPVKIDSVKLGEDGAFAFDEAAMDSVTPEFYRLRIANQTINLSIDSTETVKVKAAYPQMSFKYEVEGSENCNKIKELSLKQMTLQSNINGLVKDPNIGNDSIESIVGRMLQAYKQDIKTNYIFKEPMKAYAYYALFQTVQLGNVNTLIFNPRNNKDDVKVFAAVATSWDTYYPGAERGKNLHNIAIEGMKDIRIIENQMAQQQIEASKVSVNGCIELALQDNKGQVRRLSDLKGKVVLLDFHLFASKESTKRIMMLRELYNKYHAAGLEIYQVSVDPDEHFWKTSTAAIPWICVRDEDGIQGKSLVLLMIDAAKRASARNIIAVVPYFGWARQDRKDKPRVSIGAKLVADLLSVAGIDRLITMDLHADQIQGFFDVPVDHLYASGVILPYLQSLRLKDMVIASPDVGGSKRANTYAKYFGCPLVLCNKTRARANVVASMQIIGDVKDKNVIIVDDMVDTAGTITKAADIMKEAGAKSVRACASHCVMSGPASERVQDSALEEIVFTDSIPYSNRCAKVKQLSVADMIAETIRRVINNESISSQYLV